MAENKRFGLALGGGAARGLAHIVILETLDEMGIRPDFIAGCSIGALLGAAYASGLSAIEIREHAMSVLDGPKAAARRLFSTGLRSADVLNFSLFHRAPLNGLGLVQMVSPPGMAECIEDTVIPFAVSATNFYDASEITIEKGNLEAAVAASIAIPGIISAPNLDGKTLIDGAYTNPVPMEQVRKNGCDILLAVDVIGQPVPEANGQDPGPASFILGATQIMQKQITRLQSDIARPDIIIVPEIDRFAAHDFLRIREILEATEPERERLKRHLGNLLDNARL